MNCRAVFLSGSAVLLSLVSAARGAVVSLIPTADAFVTGGSVATGSGLPGANYGAAGALQISPPGSVKGEIQSLLKFDLLSAKTTFDATFGVGAWSISSITLQLGTNFGTAGVQPNNAIFNIINGGTFKIDWLANDNWGEGTGTPASPFTPANPPVDGVTFNSLPLLLSGNDETLGTLTYVPVGNTNPPTIPAATYPLALSPGFLADVMAGQPVSLRGYADQPGVDYLFNTKTFGSNAPTLIVNAVPEPGTVVLLVGGAFFATRRRRRHACAA